jgi:mRNA-degrading endonuclease RelE of RelBE toxin-antitoxin system
VRISFTARALRDFEGLSPALQQRVRKQLEFLQANLRHPSLRAKKYDEQNDVWQGRVNRDYRFYFRIRNDTYVVLTIVAHPK